MAPDSDCGAHPDVDLRSERALGTKVYEGSAPDDLIRLRAVAARILARDQVVAPPVVKERSDIAKMLDNKRFLAARKRFHAAQHRTAGQRLREWYILEEG